MVDKVWFVVEWTEDDFVKRVWDWGDWVRKDIQSRPENSAVVCAKDPMEAYLKALRGEVMGY